MSKICEITGKKTISGNNVSHSNRHTKRKFCCNLQNITIYSFKKNKSIRIRTSAQGLRIIEKYDDIYDFVVKNKLKLQSKQLLNLIK